jgi:AP-1 complex subunit mu
VSRYITQEGHKLEVQPRPPVAVTNAVSWRSEGIKYRKNEVFLDVIESVNLLVGTTFYFLQSFSISSEGAESAYFNFTNN